MKDQRLHILLSNDDGYAAVGLNALRRELLRIARVTVVAPDRNRSGASNSLTLDSPLRVHQVEPDVYSVNGTPTDCVHVAITGLLDDEPDMVVAGVNHGANLGDDVLYSGTVAAATEGRYLGLPAVAVSLVLSGGRHFADAAKIARRIVESLIGERPLPRNTILNVNVPDLPIEALRGLKTTRLGFRHKAEPVIKAYDPKREPIYWVGPAGAGQDAGAGTDFDAIANGFVSVTPLQVDLTDHRAIPGIDEWLQHI
jgi:5'-nucleotidase